MKTFKEFISESPSIDHTISRSGMNNSPIHPYMKSSVLNRTAKKIGVNTYVVSDPKQDLYIYFKFSNGEVQEYSMIVSDVHRATSKGTSGSPKTIIGFMKLHTQTYGVLYSDQDNTRGSQKLWVDFIKSNPVGIKFQAIGISETPVELTPKNIDDMRDVIWSSRQIIVQALKI